MIAARVAVVLPLVALLVAACADEPPGSSLPPLSSLALAKTFHRVDTPPLGLPPLDPNCARFPVTGGRFEDLDHDGVADVVLAIEGGNALVLRWDGAGLQQTTAIPHVSDLHENLVTAADVDGDGALDLLYDRRIRWGAGRLPASATDWPGGQWIFQAEVIDVDGDGRLDVVGHHRECTDGGPPFLLLRQTAPQVLVDDSARLPAGAGINVSSVRTGMLGKTAVMVVSGPGCLSSNDAVPFIFTSDGGAPWSAHPASYAGKGYTNPMAALAWHDLLWVTYHPPIIAYRLEGGALVETGPLPFQTEHGPRGDSAPVMVPWDIQPIELDGREVLLVTHGADVLCSQETRAIGPERVTAFTPDGDGWARVTNLGDLGSAGGEWRWLTIGALGGDPAVIVGQMNGEPAVFVYR